MPLLPGNRVHLKKYSSPSGIPLGEISGEHSSFTLESHLPKQFYFLACRSQEGTVLLWVPPNRLKTSGVGVRVLTGSAGETAVFQEKVLLGWTIYRSSPIPAEHWDIQAIRGSCVMS